MEGTREGRREREKGKNQGREKERGREVVSERERGREWKYRGTEGQREIDTESQRVRGTEGLKAEIHSESMILHTPTK